jgi:hypothetical protein
LLNMGPIVGQESGPDYSDIVLNDIVLNDVEAASR